MSPSSPAPLEITCNGTPRAVPAGTTVAGLLRLLDLRVETLAVERNRRVVRRRDHEATVLEAGDAVEVVTFVGGG